MPGTQPKPRRHPKVTTSRGTRAYLALVAELKAGWRRARRVCARCGQPIDYGAPATDPDSCHAGHIRSWEDYPHLRMDPSNFQPEHALCNWEAGKDGEAPGLGTTSQDW